MKTADIIVLLLVAAAVIAAVIHSIRARKKRGGGCGCGCGCASCHASSSCGHRDKNSTPTSASGSRPDGKETDVRAGGAFAASGAAETVPSMTGAPSACPDALDTNSAEAHGAPRRDAAKGQEGERES